MQHFRSRDGRMILILTSLPELIKIPSHVCIRIISHLLLKDVWKEKDQEEHSDQRGKYDKILDAEGLVAVWEGLGFGMEWT